MVSNPQCHKFCYCLIYYIVTGMNMTINIIVIIKLIDICEWPLTVNLIVSYGIVLGMISTKANLLYLNQ